MFTTPSIETLIFAFVGGIVPASIWLFFWLSEDKNQPEPPRLIGLTFLAGGVAVIISLFAEKGIVKVLGDVHQAGLMGVVIVILWAIIEEVSKYILAAKVALSSKEDDEPIDPLIYMITAALGFAAFENALFLIQPIVDHGLAGALVNGNMRFIGATLLHVVASGVLGTFMSFSFYKNGRTRTFSIIGGLFAAVALHAAFNLVIINNENYIIPAFALVWVLVIVLIYFCEKIKAIKKS